MNARREPSCDRPFVSLTQVLSKQSRKGLAPTAECNEAGKRLDVSFVGVEYDSHTEQGDAACPSDLLFEAAFDALGAARFIRTGNLTFARQAVQSALDELTTVAGRLGVLR